MGLNRVGHRTWVVPFCWKWKWVKFRINVHWKSTQIRLYQDKIRITCIQFGSVSDAPKLIGPNFRLDEPKYIMSYLYILTSLYTINIMWYALDYTINIVHVMQEPIWTQSVSGSKKVVQMTLWVPKYYGLSWKRLNTWKGKKKQKSEILA